MVLFAASLILLSPSSIVVVFKIFVRACQAVAFHGIFLFDLLSFFLIFLCFGTVIFLIFFVLWYSDLS